MSSDASCPPGGKASRGDGKAHACIVAAALLVTVSELLLKKGADSVSASGSEPSWLGFAGLLSGWVWLAIACYIASFWFWMKALCRLPLSVAYSVANLEHALIPLGAWWFLGERVGGMRWAGIGLVLVGVWIIVKPLARMQEDL